MTTIDTSRMLLELRAMAAEAQGSRVAQAAGGAAGAGAPLDFGQVMKASLEKVNEMQTSSSTLAAAFERGTPGVDLTQVMLAVQKSSIAFRAMTEVRNKLVGAYQEVMNMPV
jgi:flagellar hook-basal body complex protein FliE